MKTIKLDYGRAVELIILGCIFRVGFYRWPWIHLKWEYKTLAGEIVDNGWYGLITWLVYFKRHEWKNHDVYHARILSLTAAIAVPEGYRFMKSVRAIL